MKISDIKTKSSYCATKRMQEDTKASSGMQAVGVRKKESPEIRMWGKKKKKKS